MAVTTTTPAIGQVRRARSAGSGAQAIRRFMRNRWAVIALSFILLEVAMAVLAPLIAPYDPYLSDYAVAYSPPSAQHWLGADDLGRDMLSRIIYGTRVSYAVGVLSQVAIVLIGLPLGAV